jgi:hypothetical protein
VRTVDRRSVGGARRTRVGRGHRATVASSRSCPRQREQASLFKSSVVPSPRAATTARRAIAAATGELTALLALAVGQPSHSLP